jgi:hypothetical protein
MDFQIEILDEVNDQLGASAPIYADCTVQVRWHDMSYLPKNDAGNAIKKHFVNRGFRVDFTDVYEHEPNFYTITTRFILSKRAEANLNTVNLAFLKYIETKGYITYGDRQLVGGLSDNSANTGSNPNPSGKSQKPPPPPPKKDLYKEIEEKLKEFGLTVPLVIGGTALLIFLKTR